MQIGYYGKLPHFEDFIGSANNNALTTTIREWLNNSSDTLFHALGDNVKDKFMALGEISMLVQPEKATFPIICLWAPSKDVSGRHAPFSTYAILDNEIVSTKSTLLPEAFKHFLQTALLHLTTDDGVGFTTDHEQETLVQLAKAIPENLNSISDSYISFIEGTSIQQFTDSFDHNIDSRLGMKCLNNVIIALTPSRDTINDAFRALFRFPLSGKHDTSGQEIAFWIHMTEVLLNIHISKQSLIWSKTQLNIVFGPCDDTTLSSVMTISKDDDRLWDFATMNLDGSMMDQTLYKKMEKVLYNSSSSLVDIQNVATSLLATG